MRKFVLIAAFLAALDTTLSTWVTSQVGGVRDADPGRPITVGYSNNRNSTYQTSIVSNKIVATTNIVTVTITYQWIPEAFLGGIKLSSTSVMPMAY